MVVKLYLFPGSAPCRAVYMTAKAMNLPIELKTVDSKLKEHLRPELLKINPEHKMPTIVDGDFILWESRAIMRYLVARYGGEDNSLYPRDLHKRALVDRLLDYDLGVYYRYVLDDRMSVHLNKGEVNKEVKQKVKDGHAWLDNQVKDTKYVTGDDLTIADFALVVTFMMCEDEGVESVASYTNAMAWYKRMQQLSYYTECNQPFFDFLEKLKK